jgi:NAD(P)-dependent dehydrogenase (short-subunit alcohol dehydrogenase family)
MPHRFADRVALVTGGAGALGQAIARRLHAEGSAVAIVDRDGPRATELARTLGDRAIAIVADVTDADAVDDAVSQAIASLGGLDVVVANAGIAGRVAPLHTLEPAAFDEVIAINLRGVFLTVRSGLRAMIARGTRGAIVTMGSSMAGWDVLAGGAGYVASKHAVVGLTKAAALDAAAHGIRVNAICPGVIATELGVPAADSASFAAGVARFAERIPLRRIGTPEDVAAAVAFLASDEARHVTGVAWLLDGGQTLQSVANGPDSGSYPIAD